MIPAVAAAVATTAVAGTALVAGGATALLPIARIACNHNESAGRDVRG
jgi:hypothetical protein